MVSTRPGRGRFVITLPPWLLPSVFLILFAAGGAVEWRWRLLSRLLPRQRHLPIPWSASEVFLAFLLVNLVCPAVLYSVLSLPALLPTDLVPMISFAASVPFGVASVLLLLYTASETQPYQLGLHGHHLGRNLLLGFVAWAVVTPLAYLVQYATVSALGAGDEHPLKRMLEEHPGEATALVVLVVAVAAAPVAEEFLFRGVLQPWLTRRGWAPAVVTLIALLWAFEAGWSREPKDLAPALFVLAVSPGLLVGPYLMRWCIPNRGVAAAVFAASLLFAALHSSVWPSPVPLFVFGLAQGWLAYRTQSLVPPLVVHALFNAVACVQVFLP